MGDRNVEAAISISLARIPADNINSVPASHRDSQLRFLQILQLRLEWQATRRRLPRAAFVAL
jgi:hypothetical protein